MGNVAYIRDLNSLIHLKNGIERFCDAGEIQLHLIEARYQSKINYLRSFLGSFLKDVEQAEEDLRDAERDLRICEENADDDEDGYRNCSYEESHVNHCRRKLDHQLHRLNTYREQIRSVERSYSEYQKPKLRFKGILQFEKEAGASSLQQLINGAEDYLAVNNPNTERPNIMDLGLTEAMIKADPTMVVAASVGVAEIMLVSAFSFFGASGKSLALSNKVKDGVISTEISGDGVSQKCSELRIVRGDQGNYSQILNTTIPPGLQGEKIGRNLFQNLELLSRANDCKEISGWSDKKNIGFFQGLGYKTRNEIKDAGAEVYKALGGDYQSLQNSAKKAFEQTNAIDFRKTSGKQEINPLYVITPGEINDEKFWKQHDREGMERYIDQVEQYDKCRDLLKSGKSLDEIKREDFKSAIAYENFISKSDTIRLQKSGDYFRVDGGGRHRVAAAQIYFLRTGKIISFEAEISEKV